MFWHRVSDEVEALAKVIEDAPAEWTQWGYYFANKIDQSISIYTLNGVSSLHRPGHRPLNIKEKRKIQQAIHACLKKQIGLIAIKLEMKHE